MKFYSFKLDNNFLVPVINRLEILNYKETYQNNCFSENFNNRDKQCCGSEAYQFLYNGARLGCCGERTYNPVFEECCGNGEVSVSCMSV